MGILKIGLTGGIGSGKTTVCRIFEQINIPVYYADDRAKFLMNHDPVLKSKIKDLLGNEAYHSNGRLNRKKVGEIVFHNKEKLKALNKIVHPAVGTDGEEWFLSLKNVPYGIKEAALLVESKSYLAMDKLIVVSAPETLRIERVMLRDNVSKEAVLARIKNQLPESEKLKHADFVISNDGNQSLIQQVLSIHRILVGLSN